MSGTTFQDEDPINITEEKKVKHNKENQKEVLPPDYEDFLGLGGGRYVENNPPKRKLKPAKSFAEKRKDEERSYSNLF